MALSDLPLREELVGKNPYGAPQLEVPVALNTNENPYSPSSRIIEDLVEAVREEAPTLNRYPERDSLLLREDLAAYIRKSTGVEITKDNVWAANGSNEILQQLLQAFGGGGRVALGFHPSYSMHPILTEATDTQFINCPRVGDDFHIDLEAAAVSIEEYRPHIIFITTPNNPTGTHTSLEDIRSIIDMAPGIVVVDEAYAEFSDEPSAITLLADYPHKLVVSRTMSKAFDFAGGRLGYFIAHPDFVSAVMLVRLPYHLSVLSQMAARVALRHSEDTLATVDILVRERKRVKATLENHGYEVVPSHANFLFFKIPESYHDAAELWQAFLDQGVLIRNVGVPGFLRVTIGTPEENDIFLSVAGSLIESR